MRDKKRTVVVAHGKTGVMASVDGRQPTLLPVEGAVNADSLAKAIDTFHCPNMRVMVVGTRSDGTPGWDGVDPKQFIRAVPGTTEFLSEAQALHRGSPPNDKAAYIILATALRYEPDGPTDSNIVGSARWWVESGQCVEPVPVYFMNLDNGQVLTLGGGTFAQSPMLVASLCESLLQHHPGVRQLYIWSQDGITQPAYQSGGAFWNLFRPHSEFRANEGQVIVLPTATDMLKELSGSN